MNDDGDGRTTRNKKKIFKNLTYLNHFSTDNSDYRIVCTEIDRPWKKENREYIPRLRKHQHGKKEKWSENSNEKWQEQWTPRT